MLGFFAPGQGYFGEDGILGLAIEIPSGALLFTGTIPALRRFSVSLELAGYGNGWTDVTPDVSGDPIMIARGFQSIAPDDLVAAPAVCQLSFNNSAYNSAKMIGYYSPDNAGALPGFDDGIRIRVDIAANGNTRTRFIGWIRSVVPLAGLYDQQTTAIMATSWLQLAQGTLAETLSVQTGMRGDQLVGLLAAVPTFPPPATQYAVGLDTYPYAFDDLTIESFVIDGLDSVAKSGLDRIYEKTDGTLVFETRARRQLGVGPSLTLTDVAPAGRPGQALTSFPMRRDLDSLYNAIKLTVHPKNVDPVPVVLYAYQISASSASIPAGGSITLQGPYQDPSQLAQSVAGVNMLLATGIGVSGNLPATDWQITTAPNGGGVDISGSCAVTVVYAAASATFTINNGSASIGYISKLQCRGQGVYDYQVVSASSVNAVVANTIGKQSITIDCPYQALPTFAQTLADYLLYAYGSRRSQIDQGITIEVPATDELTADALLSLEVSQAIVVQETVTGLTGTFWVNRIQETWDDLMNLTMVLQLAPMSIRTVPTGLLAFTGLVPTVKIGGVAIPVPAGGLSFSGQVPAVGNAPVWQLGVPGSSELGQTTFLS